MNQSLHPTVQDIENALGLTKAKRSSRLLKRVIVALIVVALVAAGYWFYARQQNSAAAISYETAPAQVTDIVLSVSATGAIEPITQVEIGSEASGVVSEVRVAENDQVDVGEVLAVLDTTRLNAQLARGKAQLLAAEARLTQARSTFAETQLIVNRQKALRQKGLSTGQDMDSAEATTVRADAARAAAEADVAAAKADVSILEADLSKTRILSPITGVVLKRSVEPGQTVAASLQAPVLFQIAQDLTRIQLEAAVDEADISQVKVGQGASFSVDAWRNRDFPARIERLSFAPETVDGVVTYKAVLSASNEDLALRPGMTATARIVVETYNQVLAVPNEALRYQPPVQQEAEGFSITRMFMPRFPRAQRGKGVVAADGTRAVYVLRDGKPVEVRVKTGASDGTMTVITAGDVKSGDPLVISQKQGSGGRS